MTGEVVLKGPTSIENQNAATGSVLLKRSNSKEEPKDVAEKPEVLEASSYLHSTERSSMSPILCIAGPRPDEKVVEQTNPESETSESAYQNAAHQKSAMGQANRHRGPTVRLCSSTG